MGFYVKGKMDHRDGGVIFEPRRGDDKAPFMDNGGRRYGWQQVTNDDLDLFDADGERCDARTSDPAPIMRIVRSVPAGDVRVGDRLESGDADVTVTAVHRDGNKVTFETTGSTWGLRSDRCPTFVVDWDRRDDNTDDDNIPDHNGPNWGLYGR